MASCLRGFGCCSPPLRQEVSDGRDQPSASPHDRGHDGPQSVAGDPAILHSCGLEVQPIFWPFPRSAWAGGCPRFSGASRVDGDLLGVAEPDRLRVAVLLRRDARPGAIPERIPYAREPRQAAGGSRPRRSRAFLEAVSSLKARVALTTAYAAGLRVSEVTGLKVGDIDSARMVIHVEHGKGGKDRYVMLSPQLLDILRTYWRLARPKIWLFPGRDADKPIEPTVLHAACRSAAMAAGLRQARHRSRAAAQLRHPSAGERHRHPHHPGAARPRHLSTTARYTMSRPHDLRNAEPARPAALEVTPPD